MHAPGFRAGFTLSSSPPIRQVGCRNLSRHSRTSAFHRSHGPRSSHSNPHRPRSGVSDQNPKPDGSGRPSSKSLPQRTPLRFFRPVMRFFNWYGRQQKTRPYITQLCSIPIIYCAGDLAAQTIGDDNYDPHRSLRAIAVGAVIAIPSYRWFIVLGERFNYPSTTLSIGAKVAVTQLVYTPMFNVYFFAFHALLSGEGPTGAVERVKNTVPESIPRSFLYWPMATAISFAYVQPQSRSVVTGLFAVVWQSYLSWLNRRTERNEQMGTRTLDIALES